MTQHKTSPADFHNRLVRHDWFHSDSDDHRRYKQGAADHETLRREAHSDPVKLTMWQSWVQWVEAVYKGLKTEPPSFDDFAVS